MSFAILFPGQGSQSVGMCPAARVAHGDLFAEASIILGWDVAALIEDGPDDDLTATQHAQPALYVTAYAIWLSMAEALDGAAPAAMAGHSLGEYTAHAASGSFAFADGLALVDARGRAMAAAAAEEPSGMAALLGADEEEAETVAARRREDGGALYVANINAPGQVVVAGGRADLEWLATNARDLGIRRAVPLKVAGAFHSPFMASARRTLDGALATTTFSRPTAPVYANATAAVTEDPRAALSEQLTAPVRFSSTLEHMAAAGVDTFVHVGPGDVTAGLARRILPDATVHVASDVDDARAIGEMLSVQ